ncbi:MAG: DUF975 family protein [Spirochaetaceae bacterium]|jgi:uncharacterized membrane protein|nr:DUF975 family protein [Spirochaetaceae bacterium]
MFAIGDLKRQARSKLRGRWGTAVLLTLVVGVIHILLNSAGIACDWDNISRFWGDFSFRWSGGFGFPRPGALYGPPRGRLLSPLFSLINFFVTGAFSFALARFYVLLCTSQGDVTFGTFLEGLNRWGKGVRALLLVSLRLFLWGLLILVLCGLVIGLCAVFLRVDRSDFIPIALRQGPLSAPAFVFIASLTALFGTVVYINRIIAYSQLMFLLAEYPTVSVSKCLRASVVMTRGHRFKLLLLEMSFAGWIFLSLLSAGIGFLWLIPYMTAAHVQAYRFLKERAFADGAFVKEKNNPLPE